MALPLHAHLVNEFSKGIDSQGPYYLVQYLFDDWADSNAVLDELKGTVTRVGSNTFRSLPHQHPLFPGLFCTAARCTGLGQPVANASGHPQFNGGFLIEAEYRTGASEAVPAPDGQEDAHQIDPQEPILWCTQELDFATESIVIPHHSYRWGSSLGVLAEVPVKIEVGVTTMTLTFHRLPYLPMGVVRAKRGRINDRPFLGADEEKVRFVGAKTTRDVSSDGGITQKVQLVFQERDQSWNKLLKKDKLIWETLYDDDGNTMYEKTDLSPLIRI